MANAKQMGMWTLCGVTLALGCGEPSDHEASVPTDAGIPSRRQGGDAAPQVASDAGPASSAEDGSLPGTEAGQDSACVASSTTDSGGTPCGASVFAPDAGPAGAPPGEDPNTWQVLYDDEFNSFNASLWQTQFWWGSGTINDGSICYFSKENVSVHDGLADLEVNNNPQGGMNYTGAVMQSYGTIHFTYGYVEFRARCDRGPGLSCDFALNAEDKTWPPEINIAEIPYSQSQHDQYYTANHRRPDNLLHDHFPTGNDSTQWHTYGLLWDRGSFTWYFEGRVVYSETADVFDAPMNLSLFYGVAANSWSGHVDSTTPFPAHALIDYVRIYKRK